MTRFAKINDLITDKISGEWGEEVNGAPGVNVLRTTNFTNQGSLNLQSVVRRKISADLIAKKRLSKGDVIIEKSGGSPTQPVGRVVYFDLEGEDYLCNNFTAVLRPSKDIFPKYFFYALYFLHLSKRTLKYQNKTTGILNLKLERYLEEEQIKIPDLTTQKQIAKLLEESDIARQKRKAANELTDQFLKSTFLSMFGAYLNSTNNEKRIKLKSIIKEGDKINYGIVQPGNEYKNGVPIVRISDFDGLTINNSNLKRVDPTIEMKHKKSRIVGDEVLVACVGHTIGKVALTNPSLKGFNIVRAVARIRCDEKKVNPVFLAYYLKTNSVQNSFIKDVRTVGQPTLNISKIEETDIVLPPINLQQKFASIVADTEQLRQKQKQSEIELENLFQALLQKYFG